MPTYLKHLIKMGLFPYLIFIVNYAWSNLFLEHYEKWKIDIAMHVLGGVSIGYVANYFLALLENKQWLMVKKVLIKWLMIVCAVVATAVLWEFYEFISDYFYGTRHQPSLVDTIKDLFMGLLGGIIFCILGGRLKKGK